MLRPTRTRGPAVADNSAIAYARAHRQGLLAKSRAQGWPLHEDPLADAIQEASTRATRRYNDRYDNRLFTLAVACFDPIEAMEETRGDARVYFANLLIDHALALCGDPFYSVHWGFVTDGLIHNPKAREFLALFI